MAKSKEPLNPFYVALVVVGILFVITAFAYGTMAFRAIAPDRGAAADNHPLTEFLDGHGVELMGWELGLLAVTTMAAMMLDRVRSLRQEATRSVPAPAESDAESGREIR